MERIASYRFCVVKRIYEPIIDIITHPSQPQQNQTYTLFQTIHKMITAYYHVKPKITENDTCPV